MTPHFGKRNPGSLTAASPGDTLYIPLQFYNDSGASISIGNTLTVSDIEVFKNGSVTQRATDSGYAVLGDTGNFDNRIGFKGISISLFNTADDASFYASGSTYWVAIDSVTVDGRTIRFWAAVFDIGYQDVNVASLSDTGINNRLSKIASDVDTGLRTHIADVDTGLHQILQTAGVRVSDTGINFDLHYIKFETDTGLRSRMLQVASFVDTGLHDTLADYDTGMRGILLTQGVRVSDTGVVLDLHVIKSDADTGLRSRTLQIVGYADTGIHDTIADLDTGLRGILLTTGVLVSTISDTGVQDDLHVIRADADTGLRGFINAGVAANVTQIDGDTGAADRLGKFAGLQLKTDGTLDTGTGQVTNTLNITASASVDTGVVNNAIWNGVRSDHATAGTFGEYVNANLEAVGGDTGAADVDGTSGRLNVNASATVDTGVLANTVWNSVRADHTTAGSFGQYVNANLVAVLTDTGAADLVGGRLNTNASATVDTGVMSNVVWGTLRADHTAAGSMGEYVHSNLVAVLDDTGAADLVTGRLNVNASATVDTGVLSNVVWGSLIADHAGAGTFGAHNAMDTGVSLRLAIIAADTDTGIQSSVNVTSSADTGLNSRFSQVTTTTLTDTGVVNDLHTIRGDADTGLRASVLTANVMRINGDTGAAAHAATVFANGFADTGIEQRLARILADVDTGLRSQIADLDTGLRGILVTTGVLVTTLNDTGVQDDLHRIRADVDTGLRSYPVTANITQIRGDTGAAAHVATIYADGFGDTGINSRLSIIAADADTGLRSRMLQVAGYVDTGVHAIINDLDTGLRGILITTGVNVDTGVQNDLHVIRADVDTGIRSSVLTVNVTRIAGDTGTAAHLAAAFANGFSDTGIAQRLSAILAEVDTGLRAHISDVDTGLHSILQTAGVVIADTGVILDLHVIKSDADTGLRSAIGSDTGVPGNVDAIKAKTDSLTFTVSGQVDANIQSVNDVTVTGTGTSGDEWGP